MDCPPKRPPLRPGPCGVWAFPSSAGRIRGGGRYPLGSLLLVVFPTVRAGNLGAHAGRVAPPHQEAVDPSRLRDGPLPRIIPPSHRRAGLFELGSPRELLLDDLLSDLFVDPCLSELPVDPARTVQFAGLFARGVAGELFVVVVPELPESV